MESIWNTLKSKIKKTYNIIQNKNIIRFILEAEFKFKHRNKKSDEKIKEFFDCNAYQRR